MMHDAAHAVHTSCANTTPLDAVSQGTGAGVDVATGSSSCAHNCNNTCDSSVAESSEQPVDSSKTTQQLIGWWCPLAMSL